jgi:hypothetical protein
MGIRILTEKKTITAVEVMVSSKANAEYVAAEAKKAGFEATVAEQRAGVKGTNLYHTVIRRRTHGKIADIISFLEDHPEIDYGDDKQSG